MKKVVKKELTQQQKMKLQAQYEQLQSASHTFQWSEGLSDAEKAKRIALRKAYDLWSLTQ